MNDELVCPKCGNRIREEDCWVEDAPQYEYGRVLIMLRCWGCSWGECFHVGDETGELDEPAKAAGGESKT